MLAHLMAVVTACLYEHAGKWNPHNYGGILHVAHLTVLHVRCVYSLNCIKKFILYQKTIDLSRYAASNKVY